MKLAFSEVPDDFRYGVVWDQVSNVNGLIKKELTKKTYSVNKEMVSSLRLILQEIMINLDRLEGNPITSLIQ